MKTQIAAATLIAALSQSAFAGDNYWSNVDSGFDNMLNHAPYYGPTATTVALGKPDPAEALIHAMVRGENQPAVAQKADPYFDNVGSAFDRMFAHAPHAGPTGVTVARQLDHRVDRIVFALSQENKGPAMTMAAGKSESVVK